MKRMPECVCCDRIRPHISGTGIWNRSAGRNTGVRAGTAFPSDSPRGAWSRQSSLPKLRQIEEEEPELHIVWNEKLQEIQIQIMGEVQTEILKNMIAERFGVDVSFGRARLYTKETIADTVEGRGTF